MNDKFLSPYPAGGFLLSLETEIEGKIYKLVRVIKKQKLDRAIDKQVLFSVYAEMLYQDLTDEIERAKQIIQPKKMTERAKGGFARAAKLTPERRSEIARNAAVARHGIR